MLKDMAALRDMVDLATWFKWQQSTDHVRDVQNSLASELIVFDIHQYKLPITVDSSMILMTKTRQKTQMTCHPIP